MRKVFADTGYWLALLDPKDELHEKALEVSRTLGKARIVTSEMIFVELLAALATRGELRKAAVETVAAVSSDPNSEVVHQTSLLFQNALGRYKSRTDKEWSLTDCASFLIMEDHSLGEALAHDRHFEQAGFVALLR